MDESPPDGEHTPELFRNVDGETLRRQVLEIISDVLADSDPQKAWAREQLLHLLAAHMDDPEQALLHHLISTRNVPDSSHEESSGGFFRDHPGRTGKADAADGLPAHQATAGRRSDRG